MKDITSFINQFHTALGDAEQKQRAVKEEENPAAEESVWPEALMLEYIKRFINRGASKV
jgi:hypothetical protein